jgi:23S rRNA pseudouridine1911/1915/1917 synthase
MVINKLAGESSRIKNDKEGKKFPAPVHRLDVPVSGCLLIAKDGDAAAFLGSAFAGRAQVEKQYWAIVEKPVEVSVIPHEGELVHWLYANKKNNKSLALQAEESGDDDFQKRAPPDFKENYNRPKKAALFYRIIGEGDNYFFLEINLFTGRHHQIRAQLAAIGLHIKGDLKYGARRSEKAGGIRLHAYSLAFPNPLNSKEIIKVKSLPPIMDSLWSFFVQELSL